MLRAIGDVLTVTREIKIYSTRFFVFFLFASPKVSLVFSPTWRVPPHVSTAHSFINPGTLSLPFRPYRRVCMGIRQGFLKTAFVCGSTPCTRRLRPFASWEIGVKILDSSRLTFYNGTKLIGSETASLTFGTLIYIYTKIMKITVKKTNIYFEILIARY